MLSRHRGYVKYSTIESTLGNTPLVRLQRLSENFSPDVTILCKLEGNNPAGSVKDRPAFRMVQGAQERGEIKPGDRLLRQARRQYRDCTCYGQCRSLATA